MNRMKLKTQAKDELNPHFGFYLLILAPAAIILIANFIFSMRSTRMANLALFSHNYGYGMRMGRGYHGGPGVNFFYNGTFLSLLAAILLVGALFVMIDGLRQTSDHRLTWGKIFMIFTRGQYFIGTLIIQLLQAVWVFLWTLLLVVPGIIKALAYSQAPYIYRDAIDAGKPIGYTQAITESRRLMHGHKWDLFVLYLSFIGWGLLVLITVGAAAVWVYPYYQMTLANFYVQLQAAQATEAVATTTPASDPTPTSSPDPDPTQA